MATTASLPQPYRLIVTLESNAMVSDIKKALRLMRGIASVRVARAGISPALRASIRTARKESEQGQTIVCQTPEEMQRYFDSL